MPPNGGLYVVGLYRVDSDLHKAPTRIGRTLSRACLASSVPDHRVRKTIGRGRPTHLPHILCSRCHGPIIDGLRVQPLFSAELVRLRESPVDKALTIRGIIPADVQHENAEMSLGDQLRQRAAMGGEKERAELAAFEELLSKCIADAVVAELHKQAEVAHAELTVSRQRLGADSQMRMGQGKREESDGLIRLTAIRYVELPAFAMLALDQGPANRRGATTAIAPTYRSTARIAW